MNPENTLPIGVRIDSAQWLAMQVHTARCAAYAAISSGWALCDGCTDRWRHRVINVRALRCRGAERRGGPVARVRSERA